MATREAPVWNDLSRGVRDYFVRRYGHGTPVETIRFELEREHAAALATPEGDLSFYLGYVRGQWDCGVLDPDLLRALELLAANRPSERAQAELGRLLVRLRQPNPRPRPRLKRFLSPIYAPGDCLAIQLDDGDYGAALVLAVDTRLRHGQPNLVGTLRYKAPELPDRSVFERREWLRLTHHAHEGRACVEWLWSDGHPAFAASLIRIDRIPLRDDDPRDSNVFTGWNLGLQVELQYRWDSGDHR